MKRQILLLAILLALSQLNIAQPYEVPTDPTGEVTIPPSPQAWQFGKYGEYPVDRSTGVPSISIPIYQIKAANLSVPISLSYHASGIKVDDKSSWVGLGWSLISGGMISRVVKGHPDEQEHGYLDRGIASSIVPTDLDGIKELSYMNEGWYDSEPDEFHYNFDGHSGKFFFINENGNIKTITQPISDLKIEYETGVGGITKFTITTPQGISYEFAEYQHVRYKVNPDNLYTAGKLEWQANSAWYLTKIYSISNNSFIVFNYSESISDFEKMPKQSQTIQVITGGTGSSYLTQGLKDEIGYPNSYFSVKHLESIVYSNGKVEFIAVDDRLDSNEPRLSQIKIYGSDQINPFKTFHLTQDYFEATGSSEQYYNHRLKLISVHEEGLNGSTVPPYEISYKESGDYRLPPRYDDGQDYWGYYNGELNTSLIPQFNYHVGGGIYYTFGAGNDRNVDVEHIKSGIIERIKYPTGGITEFEFEANQVRNGGVNKYVGGLRIKNIKNFNDGNLTSQKHFQYTDPNNSTVSSGFYNAARFPEPSHFLTTTQYRYLKGTSNLDCNPTTDYYVAMSAKPNNMLGYPIGDPVTYTYVTELLEDSQTNYGKSVYHYDTFRDYILASVHSFNLDKSPLRGQLRHAYHYDKSDNLVSETIYDYDTVMVKRIFGHKVGKLFELDRSYRGFGCPDCWVCAYGDNSFCNCNDDVMFDLYVTMYLHQKYYEEIYWKRLRSETTITYGSNDITKYTQIIKQYDYNGSGHHQLTNQKVFDSNNTLHETRIKYPTDYTSPSSTISKMELENMLGVPIEKIIKVDNKIVHASATKFKNDLSFGLIYPEKQYILETDVPISSFEESSDGSTFTSYTLWGTFYLYDIMGNILEYSKDSNMKTSFIWGHDKMYPVFKIENGNYAQAMALFSTTTKDKIELGTYTLSELQSWHSTLKNMLTESFITAYAYDPHIGQIYQIDPNGITTEFNYDKNQRLEFIKDYSNNDIIRAYNYNYKPATYLSIPSSSLDLDLPHTQSTTQVNITSNASWTVEDNQTWISVSPTSGSGNGTISITASANSGSGSRDGRVKIEEVNGSGIHDQEISVNQDAYEQTLEVSPTSLNFYGTSTNTITITSDVSWTITIFYWDSSGWLSLFESASGTWKSTVSGTGNATISVKSSNANTNYQQWDADLRINGGGMYQEVNCRKYY